MGRSRLVPALLLAVMAALVSCSRRASSAATSSADSTFAGMQERGKSAMGVDQYTSAHVFEDLPDGGRIILQRDPPDTVGTGAIRAHMVTIARSFSRGEFDVPGFVHDQQVPGTAVMTARRADIRYAADTLPRGGEVRISSSDSIAVAAVHAFLAFQRSAHHAAGQEVHPDHTP